jgi:hypothetical protein
MGGASDDASSGLALDAFSVMFMQQGVLNPQWTSIRALAPSISLPGDLEAALLSNLMKFR